MKPDYKMRKALHLLSNNARTSTKDIAKEIQSSQQNASYLVQKLEKSKCIHSYSLLIDSSKFGYSNFWVLLRIRKYSKSFLNQLTQELQSYKEITAIEFLFGNFDLYIRFTTPNASYFNKIFKEFSHKHPKEITDYTILTQIVVYSFPANYLSKKRMGRKLIISGDRKSTELNTMDRAIITRLNQNARQNFTGIANELNTTSKTVINRVKNLENRNVIKGYSINISSDVLDTYRYHLFLSFDFLDEETENKFTRFCEYCPNVIEMIKVFGEWDDILVIETLSTAEFKKILFTIKEQFADSLHNYSFLESEDLKLWKYLPDLDS